MVIDPRTGHLLAQANLGVPEGSERTWNPVVERGAPLRDHSPLEHLAAWLHEPWRREVPDAQSPVPPAKDAFAGPAGR
jgi:hypothetical protein